MHLKGALRNILRPVLLTDRTSRRAMWGSFQILYILQQCSAITSTTLMMINL